MRIFEKLPRRAGMAKVERRLFETIVAGLLQEMAVVEEDADLRSEWKEKKPLRVLVRRGRRSRI
jgi:hypothetical protein